MATSFASGMAGAGYHGRPDDTAGCGNGGRQRRITVPRPHGSHASGRSRCPSRWPDVRADPPAERDRVERFRDEVDGPGALQRTLAVAPGTDGDHRG
jgi:hypothetical protein